MARGWGAISTASLIRLYLQLKRQANPYNIWRFTYLLFPSPFKPDPHPGVRDRIDPLFREHYLPPSYASIRDMLFVLERLELVDKVRRDIAPSFRSAKPKSYYALRPGKEKDTAWRNPWSAWYKPAQFNVAQRNTAHRELNQDEIGRITQFVKEYSL